MAILFSQEEVTERYVYKRQMEDRKIISDGFFI